MTIEEIRDNQLMEETLFPSIMNRVQALFFDFWIIVGATFILSHLLENFYGDVITGIRAILFVFLVAVYEPVGNMTGGTIGYRTMGMRLKKYESPSENIGFRQAYLRFIAKIILGWVSLISISSDPFKRAFHDKVSGTIVVIARVKAV